MTKRASLSASGAKISKPTYDVDTATAAQIALMLDINYAQVIKEGTISASSTVTLPGYAVAPLCFFYPYAPYNMVEPSGNLTNAFHEPDEYLLHDGSKIQVSTTSLIATLIGATKAYYLLARAARL